MIIDMDQSCLYGMTALYDKSIPLSDVKAAIDGPYGKWALPSNDDAAVSLKLWRVEPEKFAIQLSIADKKDAKRNITEAGAKRTTYIALVPNSARSIP